MQTTLEFERKPSPDTMSRAGKYLVFSLRNEEYGIEVLKGREIILMVNITPVPRAPSCVKGVINLRGKVVPVIDLRSKFGFDKGGHTEQSCIVIVEVANVFTGIIVDSVSEVVDVQEEELESSPYFGNNVNTDIFLGIAKIKDKMKILLDIDKVLNAEVTNVAGKFLSSSRSFSEFSQKT